MRKPTQRICYKGYELQPTVGGAYIVYRNNQIVVTEPILRLALNAIDNRLYSDPNFKQSGYHQQKSVTEKFRKVNKAQHNIRPLPRSVEVYESTMVTNRQIKIEVVKGKKGDIHD